MQLTLFFRAAHLGLVLQHQLEWFLQYRLFPQGLRAQALQPVRTLVLRADQQSGGLQLQAVTCPTGLSPQAVTNSARKCSHHLHVLAPLHKRFNTAKAAPTGLKQLMGSHPG